MENGIIEDDTERFNPANRNKTVVQKPKPVA